MRSILARGLGLGESRGANPLLPWGDTTPPPPSSVGGSPAAVSVTEQTAYGVAAAYTAVNILADAISTLPIRQFQGNPRLRNDPTRKEVDPSPVILEPFSEIEQIDWMAQAEASLDLRGNFYGHIIERDPKSKLPLQIKPIHPDRARVRRNSAGQIEYRFNGNPEVVPIDDVYHVRSLMPVGGLVGMDPISVLRVTLGLSRAADLWSSNFYANSAQPGGILKSKSELTPKNARALARRWMQAHQGIGHSYMPAVLSGDIDWQQVTIDPINAQFLENRQFSRSEVGSIFRIPSSMMDTGEKPVRPAGVEQDELQFLRNCLVGKIRRHEMMLTKYCCPRGQYVRLDLSHRVRGDTLQRYQAYMIARTGGWITNEEIRNREDFEELEAIYQQMLKNPMQPLNSAQNGSMTGVPGTGGDPNDPLSGSPGPALP